MAELDARILDAMYAAIEKMKRDPEEAARRARRATATRHRLPHAPWRLALRANDTRIESYCDIDYPETARARGAHSVRITCDSILELCSPVRIDWPGMDWLVAADKLGIRHDVMRYWIKRGVFVVDMCPARPAGKRGNPVPYVYQQSPLDPQAPLGRAPLTCWGTLWQHMARSVPVDHCWALRRHPEFREEAPAFHRGRVGGSVADEPDPRFGHRRARRGGAAAPVETEGEHFIGWRWICPGRIRPLPEGMAPVEGAAPLGEGEQLRRERSGAPLFAEDWELTEPRIIPIHDKLWLHTPCGRGVKMVYLPIRPWTYPDARGLWGELAEFGIPPPPDYSAQPFACHQCWQLRTTSTLTHQGWNEFVAYLTGGIVYGSEVTRTCEDAHPRRIRPKRTDLPRAESIRRRQAILPYILEGASNRAIARRLGLGPTTVNTYARRLLTDHNVTTRAELIAKLRPPPEAATAPGGAA